MDFLERFDVVEDGCFFGGAFGAAHDILDEVYF